MNRHPITASLLSALLTSPLSANTVGISLGKAPTASLQVEGKAPLQFGPVAALQIQHFWPNGDRGWLFELALRFANLNYSAEGEKRSGTFSSAGLGGGYFYGLGAGMRALALFHLIPYSTIIVASKTTSLVNGESVKYAGRTSFSGGFGMQPRIAIDRGISLFGWDSLSVFASFSLTQHNFSKRSDDTIISDASLSVKSRTSGSSDAKLFMTLLDCGISYIF